MSFLRSTLFWFLLGFVIVYFFPSIVGTWGILATWINKINTIFGGDTIDTWVISWEKVDSVDVFSTPKIEQAKRIIQKEYYHFSDKTKQEIEDGVLTSIVESLGDKHSTYFNPKDAKEFSEVLRWDFEGIGAVIDQHMKGIIIRKVFDTSPAKKAWLQDGDILVKVGSESMLWLPTDIAVKKIRWPKWSKVTIEYLRWNSEFKTVEITRDTITIPSVQATILSGTTIGYIEVWFFWEYTTQEFSKELLNLTQSWVTGLILDFRDNGGGYLDTAVEILSYFFDENTLVVRTRENNVKLTQELKTKKSKQLIPSKLPIVMLINNLSASATEIVAWAFQDYGRAVLIGEKSYGKWSVQEPFLLSDGSILKITVGRWYTPKDQNIDKNGITPDIVVPLYEADYTSKNDRQLNAAKEMLKLLWASGATFDTALKEGKTKDFTK
jgi:carboxyl-terminal processing protease